MSCAKLFLQQLFSKLGICRIAQGILSQSSVLARQLWMQVVGYVYILCRNNDVLPWCSYVGKNTCAHFKIHLNAYFEWIIYILWMDNQRIMQWHMKTGVCMNRTSKSISRDQWSLQRPMKNPPWRISQFD